VSYREAALACPGCADLLEPKEVGESTVDVCPRCAGIWVDWFDGELGVMVKGADAVPRGEDREGHGAYACPRCGRELDDDVYLDARVPILRCGECSGAFVSHASASALSKLDTGMLARLVTLLRSLLARPM
jgi:Zn-finger nucleic acid-binding protein